MTPVGQLEALTQERVIAHLQELGYRFLGTWHERENNRNVEAGFLRSFLAGQGRDTALADKAVEAIERAAALGGGRQLYDANREVYSLLRYGANVRPGLAEHTVTVPLIDWRNPGGNDFAVAEEVTVAGVHTKRPDLVLYVNGIALGVLELKRSIVSVAEGIRQNLDNQKPEFIRPFFTTVQLVMAGNDTEGLRYGVIETPEKHWLRWKEAGASGSLLLRELGHLVAPDRLLEILHDFIVFDAGVKKVCRHNQYFGVKAAQRSVRRRKGGIIWHTQGSGKSLTMVWLAKWIRELAGVDSRVLIVTDRTELDEQIEKVFQGVNEGIYRTKSGADLAQALRDPANSLICSLVHKFGASGDADVDRYVEELDTHLAGATLPGEFFVFVDECHRTQSGKLHQAMKQLLPGAMLIGFTGTPLLRTDKRSSIETFGPYIHTYKYDEAVRDRVVLDLRYEARDVDQTITSEEKVDQWFEAKTKGLSDLARAQLKQRWGTLRRVASSSDRVGKIAADILLDMEIRDRLSSGHGNALLVSDSVYAACRFYETLERTDLKGKCAIVTSYRPAAGDIKGEETGEGPTQKLRKYEVYRRMLAGYFDEPGDRAIHRVEQFEQEVKRRFIEEPGQMKLLIVVDKLLTGFDAPPATYLYIDKKMRDHGLFQAICRVNRLDGADKEYGYIVDYKDLFRSLEGAIRDYTGEAFDGYDRKDVEGLLKHRISHARKRLEETREEVKALCERVEPPRDTEAYLAWFCHGGESGSAAQLRKREPRRLALYRSVAAFLRAWANLANETAEAGYTDAEARAILEEVTHYDRVRGEVKLASGDYVDLKVFEPAMRHLLDTYVRADDAEVVSKFDDLSLVELLVQRGEAAINDLPEGIRQSHRAIAETIENNVRRLIVDEMAVNPKYFERMSQVLDALIRRRKEEAIEYRDYLKEVVELARRLQDGAAGDSHPSGIDTPPLRAIFDTLPADHTSASRARAALAVNRAVLTVREDDWRGHEIKERHVYRAIRDALDASDAPDADPAAIYGIVEAQSEY